MNKKSIEYCPIVIFYDGNGIDSDEPDVGVKGKSLTQMSPYIHVVKVTKSFSDCIEELLLLLL